MEPTSIPARTLTAAEREVLESMLAPDFPGAAQLRAQVPHTRVVALWSPGLPSVDLSVPAEIGRAPVADGEIPAGSEVRDQAGEYLGEILVWVQDGHLSALEYAWVTDQPPRRLPSADELKIIW